MQHVKNGLKAAALACGLIGAWLPARALGEEAARGLPAPAPQAEPGLSRRTFWDLGHYTWLRLTPKEKGSAPNDDRNRVDAAPLVQRLSSVRASTPDGDEALFAPAELAGLARAMGEALSTAGPGEDLLLFSSSRRSQGFLSSPLAVAARLFLKDGALNLIVQDARLEVLGHYDPASSGSSIEYGSRSRASKVVLACPGALSRRGDWLVFPLDQAPPPPPVAAPKPVQAAAHPEQEERLRALKHLLDEKLITEKEYKTKRAEIIKSI